MEVGELLVDIGRAGEFREAEQHVDRLHHDGVGVEEDDFLVFGELPQLELAEIVDRVVEGRLVALVEGCGAVQRLAAVALAERLGDLRLPDGHDAAAFPLELVEMLRLGGGEHDDRRRRAGPAERAHQRERAEAVFLVGDERRVGARRAGAGSEGCALPRAAFPWSLPPRVESMASG